ncbi:GNAT family N-acetyltransferase [Jannaschia donghaensis]
MKIFAIRPSDADALLPLVQSLAAHHDDVPAATAHTLARDLADGWIWGFGAGDPMDGYVLLIPHAQAQQGVRGADLHHVFVRPRARRQGLARRLIAAAEADARDRGCAYVVIGAHVGNEAARDTYVALDYAWTAPTFWRFRKRL